MSALGPAALFLLRLVAGFVSSALIVSFCLHSLDTHHTHPGEVLSGHEESASSRTHHQEKGMPEVVHTLSVFAHMAEKKLFVFTLFLFLWSLALTLAPGAHTPVTAGVGERVSYTRPRKTRSISFIQELFSSGILHPKLCD